MRKIAILLILMISLIALVACTNSSNTDGTVNGSGSEVGINDTALDSTVTNSLSDDFSESNKSVEIGSMI